MQPNEYALLVKDNERRCANLALADNNTINVAMETIRKASWNLYEVERVRQDLITMAERAETGGKTLAEALGPNRAELFDTMAREMEPGGFADYLCTLARPYLLSHAALVLLNTLFGTAGRQTLLLFAVLLLILPLGYLLKLAQRRIWLSGSSAVRRAGCAGRCLKGFAWSLPSFCSCWLCLPVSAPRRGFWG